jgi:hypothetical protein
MIPVVDILFFFIARHYTNRFSIATPIGRNKYRYVFQLCYIKILTTNRYGKLVLLDDPGRVESRITSVVTAIW